MYNHCTFIGRVSKEIELRRLQNGEPVANISLAVGEKYTTKSGEKKETVEWVNVVCFAKGLCGVIENYVKKGDTIQITGKMKTRSWDDQQGDKKYRTEIVITSFDGGLVMLGGNPNKQEQQYKAPSERAPDLDDDIPF